MIWKGSVVILNRTGKRRKSESPSAGKLDSWEMSKEDIYTQKSVVDGGRC